MRAFSRIAFHVCLAVALFATNQASAQMRLSDLAVGARVRVHARAPGLILSTTAELDSVSPDSVWIRRLSEPPELRSAPRVGIPMTGITRLEASTGRGSRWSNAGKGALWALGVYAVAVTGYAVHEHATCDGPDCFGEGMAWIGFVAMVPYAAGIGGAVGAMLPVESWQRVIPTAP